MSDKPKQSKWNAFKSIFQSGQSDGAAPDEPPADELPVADSKAAPRSFAAAPASHVRDDHARLAALYRVTRTLGMSLELDEVLNQVMDAMIGLTGAERGVLVLIEGDSDQWNLRVARNIPAEKLKEWETEISRTVINTAIQDKTGIVTADAMADPRFSTQASVIFNVLRSTMCTPLLARGRVIGAIYVDSRIQKGIFDERDLEMMDAFAVQAAFAIDNARIYTRTVQQVQQLKIELDEVRKARQVAEITDTDYFRQLQSKVQTLRKARAEAEKEDNAS